MANESYSGVGWPNIVAAGLEAALVLLWIGGFASGGTDTNEQFDWYVKFPIVFLAVPALVVLSFRYLAKNPGSEDRSCLVAALLWLALGINFLVFAGYAMISGGGV